LFARFLFATLRASSHRAARKHAQIAGLFRFYNDGDTIEKLPEPKIVQQGGWTAMVDLHNLCTYIKARDSTPTRRERSALNACGVDAIYFLSDHGRPHEWEEMTKKDFKEMKDCCVKA